MVDFSFTDEQQMLLDSTRRLIAAQYNLEQRRRILTSNEGFSRQLWREFASLGLLALNVPQDDGGLEAGPVGTLLVSIAMGEALVIEPYLSSAVIATRAIAKLAASSQRSQWLPPMIEGELIVVLAHEEPTTRHSGSMIDTKARRVGQTWSLSGRKAVVYHAPLADLLLVSARVEAAAAEEWALFAVPRNSSGLELLPGTTVDGQRAADVVLDNVMISDAARIGENVAAGLTTVLDYGTAALCAEAFGALDKLLAMTTEYCRTRVQFGAPIGRFQALQHRMVDMLVHVEQARSMAYLAASRCESQDPTERTASLSAAKVIIGQAARFVGQQAVQLHGGMGVTDELGVSHYFKRLLAAAARFGSTDTHLERYAQMLSDRSHGMS
jgi:alkylation response protein AidB-like acyl-CoA dehydrogenase